MNSDNSSEKAKAQDQASDDLSPMDPIQKANLLRASKRLLIVLGVSLITLSAVASLPFKSESESATNDAAGKVVLDNSKNLNAENQSVGTNGFGAPLFVFMSGVIGGFVSIQRKLRTLPPRELDLIANSWVYTSLPPLAGGVLALLLYTLFLSEILTGALFPEFEADSKPLTEGIEALYQQHGDFQDYAKLIFWCFVAGFSQNFVTGLIGKFENSPEDIPASK